MVTKEEKKPEPIEDDDEELEDDGPRMPSWVMTFADLVTLLMVFFVLLFAMGSIEDEKWRLIKESLRDALGAEVIAQAGTRQGLDVIQPVEREKTADAIDEVDAMVSKEIEEISSEVEEFVYKKKLAGHVEVTSDERGAIITIADKILFPAGTSRMNYEGTKTVKQIFELLNQFHYDVTIEGHTDDSPMKSAKFPSNWELSAARAADVARILVRQGLDPKKLSIQGFAEFRPKLPNDRPENRAVNRRIEIVYQRGSIKKNMVDILRRKKMISPG
jgi:chemotaxis protein MotB